MIRAFGSQLSGARRGANIVAFANHYNSFSPAKPFYIDALLIAPYLNILSESNPDPAVAATVNPTGGGATGGTLTAGAYLAYYTWIDAVSGKESGVGTSKSAVFNVAATNVPTVTIPVLPAWASSANLYLTPANGAAGTEVLYATGVTTTTVNLPANVSSSTVPPNTSRIPSIALAAASIASGHVSSAAYGSTQPWTRTALLEWYRHYIKYNSQYNGSGGWFAKMWRPALRMSRSRRSPADSCRH